MENAQKAIMIGVGLFITIIIIAAVMLITGMGQSILNKGQNQVTGISESLMNDLVAQYDGKSMTGAQVRSAATTLVNRNETGITVSIKSKTVTDTAAVNTAIKNAGGDTAKFTGSVTGSGTTVTVTFQ